MWLRVLRPLPPSGQAEHNQGARPRSKGDAVDRLMTEVGGSFAMGLAMGFAYNYFRGLVMFPGPGKQVESLNWARRAALKSGGNFAGWTLMFGATNMIIERHCDNGPVINSYVASCIASVVQQLRFGPRRALTSGWLTGTAVSLMEGSVALVTKGRTPTPRQIFYDTVYKTPNELAAERKRQLQQQRGQNKTNKVS